MKKFICSVEINSPVENVVKLFDNPDNLKYWQDGFQSLENISGKPGEEGVKSKIVFNNKGRVIELTETIIKKNLPHEMTALYEHPHMDNYLTTRFIDLGGNRTRFENEGEYIRFSLVPKVMSVVMPGVFRKPVQKWLNNFKEFVEKNNGS